MVSKPKAQWLLLDLEESQKLQGSEMLPQPRGVFSATPSSAFIAKGQRLQVRQRRQSNWAMVTVKGELGFEAVFLPYRPHSFLFLITYVHECFVSLLCLCTMYMPGAHRGQKRTQNPPEFKLWMTVSHPVRAGNQTWGLWKNSQAFGHWAISLAP